MIQLTEEQRQELTAPEPVAIDPTTNEAYVLVRKDLYKRMKELLDDEREQTAVLAYSMNQAAQIARENPY